MAAPSIGGGVSNRWFTIPAATGSEPAATNVRKLSDTASIMNNSPYAEAANFLSF